MKPPAGPVGPSVVRRSDGRRTCRGCAMVFHAKDAIGLYPTEYGDAKGLYYDNGVLRHDCKKGSKS